MTGKTNSDARPVPAAPHERIAAIDALRGFALLGVLLANLAYWAGLPFANDEQIVAIGGVVGIRNFARFFNFVLDGKFYTLFSLLFGLGFALQLDRLERRGTDGLAIFRRRMWALLLIGAVHLLLIWDGDILTLYAMLGFALPLFRRVTDRTLLVWSLILLFAVPLAGAALGQAYHLNLGEPMFQATLAAGRAMGVDFLRTNAIGFIGGGGWHEWSIWQSTHWAFTYAERLSNWRFFKVLGTMLLGMLAGRYLLRGDLVGNQRLLRKVLIVALVVGLPANLVYMNMPPHAQAAFSSLIGSAPIGIAYGAGFLLLWPGDQRILRVLAPLGRMALTNYLAQSIICTAVFYGIGLGLMGRVQILWVYLGGIALFAAQVVVSRRWLERHEQGPAEALWRRLTYGPGRRLPIAA